MTHTLTRDEYRVVRVHAGELTEFGRYRDKRKAADRVGDSKAVLPNTPVKIQTRTATTTYSDWEDLT